MKIIEDIIEEVNRAESFSNTNVIVHYQDIEGSNFFEKMEALRWALNALREEHNLALVEDTVVPKKFWQWNVPIYFDPKFKFLQFNLERVKEDSHSEAEFKVECGSIWRRPVDGTVVEIQGIADKIIYVRVVDGPGLVSDTLNQSVLQMFWTKKSNG